MRGDPKRLSGFYWVRFEGSVIVAEYTSDGIGCSPEGPHWHVPQSEGCHLDKEVCELLSGRLEVPECRWCAEGNPRVLSSVSDAYVHTRTPVGRVLCRMSFSVASTNQPSPTTALPDQHGTQGEGRTNR